MGSAAQSDTMRQAFAAQNPQIIAAGSQRLLPSSNSPAASCKQCQKTPRLEIMPVFSYGIGLELPKEDHVEQNAYGCRSGVAKCI